MEISDYRVVRLIDRCGHDDPEFAIVYDGNIVDGNLCDICCNGIPFGHKNAEDYSWGDEDFDHDLLHALAEHLGTENDLEGLCVQEDSITIETWDDEQVEFLQELLWDKEDEIRAFCDTWANDHECCTKAKYIDYWDGSNRQGILLSHNGEDVETYDLLDADDEEALRILTEYLHDEEEVCEEDAHGREFMTSHFRFCVSYHEGWTVADCWSL